MENIFIAALVRAGTCRQHASERPRQTGSCYQSSRKPLLKHYVSRTASRSTHAFHSNTQRQTSALPAIKPPMENDPRQFVDFYLRQDHGEEDQFDNTKAAPKVFDLPALEAPQTKRIEDDKISPSIKPSMSEKEEMLVEEIRKMVEAESENQREIYEAYRTLPHPRIVYLPRRLRNRLLLKLSVVEKKTLRAMQQYISVLEDVKVAGLHIFLSQWNSAIHLVGRHFGGVTAEEAEAAVVLYKEMERAGIEGNHVTFNILFDIAVKAGNFAFAEVILREMGARKLEIDRHGSIGLIYYQGLRHSGQGIRDAYMKLVSRGQIVDTVVLNCVMVSLLNAGERAAAEQVYYRMRRVCTKDKDYVFEHQTFRDKRNIARILSHASKTLAHSPEALKQLQDEQPCAPNFETYKILLRYHVETTGELIAVTAVLDDMAVVGVPAYGRVYTDIFKGFAIHGGVPYTAWTRPRLESIWRSFMNAASVRNDTVYIGKWSVIWVLRAFNKCSGHEAALTRWEAMKKQWSPTEEEAEVIHGILSHQEYLKQRGWQ